MKTNILPINEFIKELEMGGKTTNIIPVGTFIEIVNILFSPVTKRLQQ
jgi:hypothetical protein